MIKVRLFRIENTKNPCDVMEEQKLQLLLIETDGYLL